MNRLLIATLASVCTIVVLADLFVGGFRPVPPVTHAACAACLGKCWAHGALLPDGGIQRELRPSQRYHVAKCTTTTCTCVDDNNALMVSVWQEEIPADTEVSDYD